MAQNDADLLILVTTTEQAFNPQDPLATLKKKRIIVLWLSGGKYQA